MITAPDMAGMLFSLVASGRDPPPGLVRVADHTPGFPLPHGRALDGVEARLA